MAIFESGPWLQLDSYDLSVIILSKKLLGRLGRIRIELIKALKKGNNQIPRWCLRSSLASCVIVLPILESVKMRCSSQNIMCFLFDKLPLSLTTTVFSAKDDLPKNLSCTGSVQDYPYVDLLGGFIELNISHTVAIYDSYRIQINRSKGKGEGVKSGGNQAQVSRILSQWSHTGCT